MPPHSVSDSFNDSLVSSLHKRSRPERWQPPHRKQSKAADLYNRRKPSPSASHPHTLYYFGRDPMRSHKNIGRVVIIEFKELDSTIFNDLITFLQQHSDLEKSIHKFFPIGKIAYGDFSCPPLSAGTFLALSVRQKSYILISQNVAFNLAAVDKNDTVSFGFKWFHSKMKPLRRK